VGCKDSRIAAKRQDCHSNTVVDGDDRLSDPQDPALLGLFELFASPRKVSTIWRSTRQWVH
jgi:hypothetical protein